jgi:plasmid stabilization system protein ParE
MNYSFHPFAEIELNEAIDYYEKHRSGLGEEFSNEVYSTIQRIIQNPKAWSKLSENTRRCLTNRFPYGVIYQIKGNKILIIAVMHLSRKPNYWQNRIAQ